MNDTPLPADYEPVTGPVAEAVQAEPLVIVAYGLIWAAALFYLWTIHRRQTRLHADILELGKQAINRNTDIVGKLSNGHI